MVVFFLLATLVAGQSCCALIDNLTMARQPDAATFVKVSGAELRSLLPATIATTRKEDRISDQPWAHIYTTSSEYHAIGHRGGSGKWSIMDDQICVTPLSRLDWSCSSLFRSADGRYFQYNGLFVIAGISPYYEVSVSSNNALEGF